jgi:hypothetical protein
MNKLVDSKDWDEMISWCPTQLSKTVYIYNFEFILYLRWRHVDPFTYNIFSKNDNNDLEKLFGVGWSIDIFEKYNLYYTCDDFDKNKIEKDAEDIWYLIEKPRIEKILLMNEEILI